MPTFKLNRTFSENGEPQLIDKTGKVITNPDHRGVAQTQEICRVVILKCASNDISDLMEKYADANPKAVCYQLGHKLPPHNGVEIDINESPITFSEELGNDFLIMVNHETFYMAGEEARKGFDLNTGQEGFAPKSYYDNNIPNLESVPSGGFGGLEVV